MGDQQGEASNSLSRGQCMLEGDADGLLLINGMPSKEDETIIRHPPNKTLVLTSRGWEPILEDRFLIRHGQTRKFKFPGGTEFELTAD